MLWPFYLALLTAFLFYAFLPVMGAFSVRSSWRRFRSILRSSLTLPYLGFGAVHKSNADDALEAYRFFGEIEASGATGRYWLRGSGIGAAGRVSVSVDLRGALIYAVPGEERLEPPFAAGALPDMSSDEAPAALSWRSLSYLEEGAKVFVCGPLEREGGRALFRGSRGRPLLVLLYEADESALLVRATRMGRQKNEYWNRFTPISLALGACFMALILILIGSAAVPPALNLLMALVAFLPISVFLVPGVFLLLAYRYAWKRAREIRAARDLARLPESFPGGKAAMDLLAEPPASHLGARAAHWQALAFRMAGRASWSVYRPEDRHDPMICAALVPGEPGRYARACTTIARWWTIFSGLCVVLACVVNNFLLFQILRLALGL